MQYLQEPRSTASRTHPDTGAVLLPLTNQKLLKLLLFICILDFFVSSQPGKHVLCSSTKFKSRTLQKNLASFTEFLFYFYFWNNTKVSHLILLESIGFLEWSFSTVFHERAAQSNIYFVRQPRLKDDHPKGNGLGGEVVGKEENKLPDGCVSFRLLWFPLEADRPRAKSASGKLNAERQSRQANPSEPVFLVRLEILSNRY